MYRAFKNIFHFLGGQSPFVEMQISEEAPGIVRRVSLEADVKDLVRRGQNMGHLERKMPFYEDTVDEKRGSVAVPGEGHVLPVIRSDLSVNMKGEKIDHTGEPKSICRLSVYKTVRPVIGSWRRKRGETTTTVNTKRGRTALTKITQKNEKDIQQDGKRERKDWYKKKHK